MFVVRIMEMMGMIRILAILMRMRVFMQMFVGMRMLHIPVMVRMLVDMRMGNWVSGFAYAGRLIRLATTTGVTHNVFFANVMIYAIPW